MPRPKDDIIKAMLLRIYKSTIDLSKFMEDSSNITEGKLNSAILMLEENRRSYDSNIDLVDTIDLEIGDFETLWLDTRGNLQDALISLTSGKSKASVSSSSCLPLPTVSVPIFNGNQSDWKQFYDTFNSLILKQQKLSDIQKFHYLISALRGDALNLIKHLPISTENFQVAWSCVFNRFNDPEGIAVSHIEKLLNLPDVKPGSFASLELFHTHVSQNLSALEQCEINIKLSDLIWETCILKKLDPVLREQWYYLNPKFVPLENLLKFLSSKIKALRSSSDTMSHTTAKFVPASRAPPRRQKVFVAVKKSSTECLVCHQSHYLFQCSAFKQMSVEERSRLVISNNLCKNCLSRNLLNHPCSKLMCRFCSKKHHSLLHRNNTGISKTNSEAKVHSSSSTVSIQTENVHMCSEQPSDSNMNPDSIVTASVNSRSAKNIILPTAEIIVEGLNGNLVACRALIDSGSQINAVSNDIVQLLKLPFQKKAIEIHTLNSTRSGSNSTTILTVKSNRSTWKKTIECVILPKISSNLPSQEVNKKLLKIPRHVKLADSSFHRPGKIDILLGVEVFCDIFCSSIPVGETNCAINLINTKIGTIIAGCAPSFVPLNDLSCFHVESYNREDDLSSVVKRFWELEKIPPQPNSIKDHLNHPAEQLFKKEAYRLPTGRFVVSLPFKQDPSLLGYSFNVAKRRFEHVERKLDLKPLLKKKYVSFMRDYIMQGHATIVNNPDLTDSHFYSPHFYVENPASETTKLRIVFDASTKSSSGFSLNDLLHTGPTIQGDLFHILLNFRMEDVAIAADIKQFYRQVVVHPDHQKFQYILWRENPHDLLATFQLTTVTYGMASSSFLASRCLLELAKTCQAEYPSVSNVLANCFYVDDMLLSMTNIHEAINVIKNLLTVLGEAGFQLCKFCSNSKEFLDSLSNDLKSEKVLNLHSTEVYKTLGIQWDPILDQFLVVSKYSNLLHADVHSKRSVLSVIASIWDPLGLCSPFVITLKVFMQKLWAAKLEWDQELPSMLQAEWLRITEGLNHLNSLTFPRKVLSQVNTTGVNLFGFADASQVAYGCVIYLKSASECKILCSKSKVCPLSPISLPRKELLAADLLAKLFQKICSSLSLALNSSYLFSDSSIVLSWLKQQDERKLESFVKNKVFQIRNLTENATWHHCSSRDNPADIVSRGCTVKQLITSKRWIEGPAWVFDFQPSHESRNQSESSLNVFAVSEVGVDKDYLVSSILPRFSSYGKSLRVLALCHRFVSNCRAPRGSRLSILECPLSPEELQISQSCIVQNIQAHAFEKEILSLRRDSQVQKSSKIKNLFPFLDSKNIIRVGGRLEKSNLSHSQKHPIILPSKNHFVRLLIRDLHERLYHGGIQLILSQLRARFWVISARRVVSSVINSCFTCKSLKKVTNTQLMGSLPPSRVTMSEPFSNVSLDYCGPFQIRTGLPRSKVIIKIYVCIFICHATKAVHFEPVQSLLTQHFMDALHRHSAHHGLPKKIFSDNATTFVRASKDLKELANFLKNKNVFLEIQRALSSQGVSWNFQPPYSPFRSGLVERMVRTFKFHFKRTLKGQILTFPQFLTFCYQLESIINSRPLYVTGDKPDDVTVITPHHLITGFACSPFPLLRDPTTEVTSIHRYQTLKRYLSKIWDKWSHEYLSLLQSRNKWQFKTQPLSKGDFVCIREDSPQLSWPYGEVIDIYPDSSGVVRTVAIRTSKGIITRPVQKLCKLPFVTQTDSQQM